MACAPCAAAAAALNNSIVNTTNNSFITSESKYNLEQLQIWNSKLNCIKLQVKYHLYNTTPVEINKFLGIVKSAIRNPENIGYFEKDLDVIYNFIIFVTSKNDC